MEKSGLKMVDNGTTLVLGGQKITGFTTIDWK